VAQIEALVHANPEHFRNHYDHVDPATIQLTPTAADQRPISLQARERETCAGPARAESHRDEAMQPDWCSEKSTR
jgi:hypothetical protein